MTARWAIRALALAMCLALMGAALPGWAADASDAPAEDGVAFASVEPDVPAEDEILLMPGDDSPGGDAPDGPQAVLAPEGGGDPETPADPEAPSDANAPSDPNAPNDASAPSDPEAPGDASAPEATAEAPSRDVPGWETRVVNATAAVDSATWEGVNLVRAEGFDGKLAVVTGTLTLKNVLIEGEAIDPRALTDDFELGPYGVIVLNNGKYLTLNAGALSFNRGDARTMTLRWKGKKVSGSKARWYTSDKSVVKVSKSGKITARRPGTAVIGAKYKKIWVFCRVVVTDFIYVKRVSVAKKMTLALNCATPLRAAVYPADAIDADVAWSSSNAAVASVDENGLVTGLASGTAYIYAKTANGTYGRCKVTVREIKPSSVRFARDFITLNPGDGAATAISLSPAQVSNPRVVYSSSDPSVATVDETGAITAAGVGRATITVRSAANARACDTCTVFVVEPGSGRLAGLVIGLNPGHQTRTIYKKYPLAPGSKKKAYGCKVGAGGRWTHIPEYEVVLQIGLKLQQLLTDAGATVVMTRTTNNVCLTNIQRAQILNRAHVDVALQLHCNSNKNKSHHGCSAYVRTTGSWYPESKAIAKVVIRNVSAATGMTNKGVKTYNGYMSLNWSTTPSVLLELGYLSNKTEDRLLATDDFRDKIAQGIFEGLCEYYGR